MEDLRLPFDEAEEQFRTFLRSQGWPDALLWLSRDRFVGRRRRFWVFRPEELESQDASRAFYEGVRGTPSSIRLDAVARIDGRSLAFVHDYGGPSRKLDFGVAAEPWDVRPVSSWFTWLILRTASRLWGSAPFLRANRITGAGKASDSPTFEPPAP
jgi:hypothetical protein